MPNSTIRTTSSGLYVPGSASSRTAAHAEDDLHDYLDRAIEGIENFARREPWAFATWVFGVGFVLGWKLKPW